MVIAPVRILKETPRAYVVRWFDYQSNDHVKAVISKRVVTISGVTMYIEAEAYEMLNKVQFRL